MDIEQELLQDPILVAKYQFITKLGEGCFGKIYKVRNKEYKIFTALKVEVVDKHNYKKSLLQNEADILKKLKGKPYVPNFYCFGEWNHGTYIQIQLLVKDLNSFIDKTYTFEQISILTIKLVQSLAILHSCQIIHQDIKPQNIMINNKAQYVFIDFGISRRIKQIPQGKPISKRIKGFIGTPRYASIQAHKGLQQSKRDDLESLLYNIAYLYFKKLPWLSLKVTGTKKIQQIRNTKQKTSTGLFQQMGKPFHNAFQYIRKLEHMQQPNYKYLIGMFTKRSHSMIIVDKRRQFGSGKQNEESKSISKRGDFKKMSLNLGQSQGNGNFLQLPSFVNKMKNVQVDQISQSSFNKKNASNFTFNNNNQMNGSMNGSMQGSKAMSVRVYNDNQERSSCQNDEFQKDIYLQEENTEPSVQNISKFLSPIEMKNPFCNRTQ